MTDNNKLFYSIGEVAKMFDVNASLIRYWEGQFDIIKPRKNKRGVRYFTDSDIENFKIIYTLLKERGMTIKGAQRKLKENKDDTINNIEIVNSLKKVKGFLNQILSDMSD